MAYGVVHTTNLGGCDTYSFQFASDIENGRLVAKGDLVAGEREVYEAVLDATKPAFLVANPAWIYDDARYVNKQEDAFINVAGKAFRVYELKEHKKFAVTDVCVDGDVVAGDVLGVNADGKLDKTVADSALLVKVNTVDNYGFAYAVGSVGNVDTTHKLITVEVIKNA